MFKVLVTDASERSSLAVIRSLGSKGIKVIAADSNYINSGFLSKYCYSRIRYPSPLENKSQFCKSLLNYVQNNDIDLLIPVTDSSILPIIEYRTEFEKYVKIALPSTDSLLKTIDKWETNKLAKSLGVPHPKTFLISSFDDLKYISSVINYPCVIKPRSKVIWINERAFINKVTPDNYVYHSQDLLSKYKKLFTNHSSIPYDYFMIQECVIGKGYGVEVLMKEGKLISIFVHKRLREYPITGGASTLRISTINKDLIRYATILLKYLKWDGVAMVEFKLNEEKNDINLIEINGRLWGSLPLAINSGVDFPYLLFLMMTKNQVSTINNYMQGQLQKWFFPGDLLWFITSLQKKRDKLAILLDFLSTFYVRDDVISIDDPKPIIGDIIISLNNYKQIVKGSKNIYGENKSGVF